MIRKIGGGVFGDPVPQGSKRAFRAGTRMVVTDVNSKALHTYRESIANMMAAEIDAPVRVPVRLVVMFYFARPQGHFGKKGLLPSAPGLKTTKPDVDKCLRAVLDALTGVAYYDDSQVWSVTGTKAYVDGTVSFRPQTYVIMEYDDGNDT